MKQRESAFTRKLNGKVLDKRSVAGASRHFGYAAVSGVLAASLVLLGVLFVGFPTRTLNSGNSVAQNQRYVPASTSAPRIEDTAFPMPASSEKSGSSAALIKKGKQIFQAHTCSACHGPTAQGTAIAPPLAGIGHYFNEAMFSDLIHHPRPPMAAKGMPPAPLSDQQTHALWAYLNSMPVPAHRAPGVPAVVIFKKTAVKATPSTTPRHAIAAIRSQHRTAAAAI